MRKSIKLDGIAEAWINHEPKTKAISADDVKKAIEWAKVHIHINSDEIQQALIRIYGDGFILGKDAAMHELTGQILTDWAKWKPGNRGAAALVARYNGLLSLVTNSSQVISGLNSTTYNRLGRVLAESLAEGKSGRATAKRITEEMGHIIDDPARALTIAVTETRRAVSAASMQAYTAAGVKQVSWLIAEGEGLCDACRGNSEDSPVDMGEAFSSGDYAPPAHPNCRCAVQPNVATEITQDEFESMFAEYEADMALAIMPTLVKYDEEQPRDERGRFSSTAGESDTGVESQFIAAGDISERARLFLAVNKDDLFRRGIISWNGEDGKTLRQATKYMVASDIANRMREEPIESIIAATAVLGSVTQGEFNYRARTEEQIQQALVDPNLGIVFNGESLNIVNVDPLVEDNQRYDTQEEKETCIREYFASVMLGHWAGSSNDAREGSLVMQERAAELFGIEDHADWEMTDATSDRVDEIIGEHGLVIDSFLQSQYDSTQDFLKSSGITELSLTRGTSLSSSWTNTSISEGESQDVLMRPLSSWTYEEEVSAQFGSATLTSTFPAERIFSLPVTGLGCLGEREVVVLGGTIKADVVSNVYVGKLDKYRDDQERDAHGRWTASVGGADLVRRGTEETLKWMETNRFGYRQEDGTFYISEYHEEQAVKVLARRYEAEGLGKRNAVRAAEAEISRLDIQQRCEREIATRAEYEARIAKDDPQWYQETYLPNQEIAQQQIQQAYDTGKVTIAIDPESFIEMLDDGRYKTQFETKTTHGTKDLEMRKVTEDIAMGLPVDMKTSDRPIYGFLTTNTEAITPYDDWAQNRNTTEEKWRDTLSVNSRMVDQYGEIRLVMNDDVRDRTTATVDDSLRNARFALPLGTQLTQDDFVFNGAARSGYPDHTGGSPILRYMETQTVGGVRLSDIAEIHAPEELLPEIQVMLERQGLNVPVIARAK